MMLNEDYDSNADSFLFVDDDDDESVESLSSFSSAPGTNVAQGEVASEETLSEAFIPRTVIVEVEQPEEDHNLHKIIVPKSITSQVVVSTPDILSRICSTSSFSFLLLLAGICTFVSYRDSWRSHAKELQEQIDRLRDRNLFLETTTRIDCDKDESSYWQDNDDDKSWLSSIPCIASGEILLLFEGNMTLEQNESYSGLAGL